SRQRRSPCGLDAAIRRLPSLMHSLALALPCVQNLSPGRQRMAPKPSHEESRAAGACSYAAHLPQSERVERQLQLTVRAPRTDSYQFVETLCIDGEPRAAI